MSFPPFQHLTVGFLKTDVSDVYVVLFYFFLITKIDLFTFSHLASNVHHIAHDRVAAVVAVAVGCAG